MAVVENEVELDEVEPVAEEVPVVDRERWAKGVATTEQRREERRAAAPPPGEAKTIEEVLARGRVTGTVAARPRRDILEALVAAGGSVEDDQGKAAVKIARALGKGEQGFAGLLKSMEREGLVGRWKSRDGSPAPKAKKTYRIFLLDPLVPQHVCEECDGKTYASSESLRKHREKKHRTTDLVRVEQAEAPAKSRSSMKGGAAALMPPMPQLGSNVTVFAQIVERDGTVKIGVRNEEGDYMTSVEGWRAVE